MQFSSVTLISTSFRPHHLLWISPPPCQPFIVINVVSGPTRITSSSSTLIDHVYIYFSSCSTLPPLGSSDHSCISVALTWSTTCLKRLRRQIWFYRSGDLDQANDLLAETLPSDFPVSSDIDSIWTSWKTQFLNTMSRCVPSRIVTIRKTLPWLSADTMRGMKKRDYFLRLYKSTGSLSLQWKFCLLRNKVVSLVRKAKSSFLKNMTASIHTPKQFWSMYYSLTPNRERIPHTLSSGR